MHYLLKFTGIEKQAGRGNCTGKVIVTPSPRRMSFCHNFFHTMCITGLDLIWVGFDFWTKPMLDTTSAASKMLLTSMVVKSDSNIVPG